jgi:hypothetical protein
LARKSKYTATIDKIMHTDVSLCKIDINGKDINTVYNGFTRAIKNNYLDKKITVSRIDGEIFIEKL